ncbi:hypothetical protein ACFOU2_25575 [Bacillus songklensis]|uniref:ThiC-associated domain-containing protein n=1 Tax=Bacillus songklensis TaxID=1069116 RepID=A0ABV8BB41_9BACI
MPAEGNGTRGSRKGIQVPMREMEQHFIVGVFGEEKNPSIRVCDSSGFDTDPSQKGIPKVRFLYFWDTLLTERSLSY